ncbi:MAG: tyrosine-type recombinase/integrase [Promethearchaeota archaeon]
MRISEILPDFLAMKVVEEGRSPATAKAYRHDLSLFTRVVGDLEVESLRAFHVRKFLRVLQEREYSRRGLARKIACLRSFCTFLMENEVISGDPMKRVKSPRVRAQSTLPKYLTTREMGAIFQLLESKGRFPRKNRPRLELVVRFLYSTMVRVSELVNLRLRDLDFNRGVVRVFGKGAKERLVPVDRGTLDLAREYLFLERGLDASDPANGEEYLLTSSRGGKLSVRTIQRDVNALRTLVSDLRARKVTPHVFRHSGATHLRQNGMDLSELQDILGHSNPNTTRIYARNDISTLRRSYVEMHPLAGGGLAGTEPVAQLGVSSAGERGTRASSPDDSGQ